MTVAPLKIFHVQTRFMRAGAEENTWESCVHQSRMGHEVMILCGPESNFSYYEGLGTAVTLKVVPSLVRDISPGKDYRCYKELRSIFAELRPDVVHTHTSKAGTVGRAAAARVPTVIHGVHMLPFSNIGIAEKLVYVSAEHAVAKATHHFIHVSHGTSDAYRLAMIGRKTPHSVVRSGMDIDKFRAAALPDDWQDMLGIAPGEDKPKVILMLAALEARKRQGEFLEGFASATGPGENIRLILAGEGPDRERLVAQIATLGLADRVRITGFRQDPERLIAMSDIGVLSSLREGLPRVVVQYLAGGKPAIVSPLRGIEEVIRSGTNGLIAQGKSAASVATLAVTTVRNDATLRFLTRGAKTSPVDDWSRASMFDQLDEAYLRAVGPAYRGHGVATAPARVEETAVPSVATA